MSNAEQDQAAGGFEYRSFYLPDRRIVVASIAIKKFKSGHQLWGYLQFKFDGKSRVFYVGKVTSESRAKSLTMGWELVRKKKIIEKKDFCGVKVLECTWLFDNWVIDFLHKST